MANDGVDKVIDSTSSLGTKEQPAGVDTVNFLACLNAGFPNWNPTERTAALQRGSRLGFSNRSMAVSINKSEGTVRNYLRLLKLPATERQELTAQGEYRRALKRVSELEDSARAKAAAEEDRLVEETASHGYKLIRSFFFELKLASAFAEQVLEAAKFHIWDAEQAGLIQSSAQMWSKDYKEVIAREKPSNLCTLEGTDYLNAIIRWFCRWLVGVIPNIRARGAAIDLALDRHYTVGI
jgi:hypothetical protein